MYILLHVYFNEATIPDNTDNAVSLPTIGTVQSVFMNVLFRCFQ